MAPGNAGLPRGGAAVGAGPLFDGVWPVPLADVRRDRPFLDGSATWAGILRASAFSMADFHASSISLRRPSLSMPLARAPSCKQWRASDSEMHPAFTNPARLNEQRQRS